MKGQSAKKTVKTPTKAAQAGDVAQKREKGPLVRWWS